MKKILLFIALICISALSTKAQTEVKTGLLVGAGQGSVFNTKFALPYDGQQWTKYNNPDAYLGYRFRLKPMEKRYFYDLDVVLGLNRYTYNNYLPLEESNPFAASMDEKTHWNYQLTFNASWNYRFYEKWYAGIGLAPKLNLLHHGGSGISYKGKPLYDIPADGKLKFDLPVTAKVGYDFKYFELAFQYSYGFFNLADARYMKRANLRNWQVQLFLPF